MYRYDSIEDNEISSEILIISPQSEIETNFKKLDNYLTNGMRLCLNLFIC
jgi:hypothetical protein